MLMLGESIFSLLIVQVDNPSEQFHSVFFFGISTIIFLQLLHFQSQPHHADQHAARRNKDAGILYSLLLQLYSFALVLLGAAFTFFLTFAESAASTDNSSEYNANRLLADPIVDADAANQKAAHLFSGAMATIFSTLDITTILHLGFEESRKRLQKAPIKGSMLAVLRTLIILFMATLSQWQTIPKILAVCGFLAVLAQLLLRKLGLKCMAKDCAQHVDTENHQKTPTNSQKQVVARTEGVICEGGPPSTSRSRFETRDESCI